MANIQTNLELGWWKNLTLMRINTKPTGSNSITGCRDFRDQYLPPLELNRSGLLNLQGTIINIALFLNMLV